MIITNINNGFGNQLFMYACGYAVAKRLDQKLMLDISYLDTNTLRNYELDKLNICFDKLFSVSACRYYLLKVFFRKLVHAWMRCRYTFIHEKEKCEYSADIDSFNKRTYLFWCLQSENYFTCVREDLIKMFTPKYELSEGCKEYITQVRTCHSVAVHVRRGDYVALGNCLDDRYYDEAIKQMNKHVENPIYYVFSDDLAYARQMFAKKTGIYKYVEYQSDNLSLDDFFIMKECNHIIMANSSYSWWAAWLNTHQDKIVVCPSKQEQGDCNPYPKSWIKL